MNGSRSMNDAQLSSAQTRALILSKAIKRRDDVRIRTLIEDFIKMRNVIGQEAERAVRDKLLQWIEEVGIPCEQKGAW